jgi:hypothetical protein
MVEEERGEVKVLGGEMVRGYLLSSRILQAFNPRLVSV